MDGRERLLLEIPKATWPSSVYVCMCVYAYYISSVPLENHKKYTGTVFNLLVFSDSMSVLVLAPKFCINIV